MKLLELAINVVLAAVLLFGSWLFVSRKKESPSAHKNEAMASGKKSATPEERENSQSGAGGSNASECAHCGVSGVALKPCGRCKRVFYCGKNCQEIHWKHKPNGHKQSCQAAAGSAAGAPTKKTLPTLKQVQELFPAPSSDRASAIARASVTPEAKFIPTTVSPRSSLPSGGGGGGKEKLPSMEALFGATDPDERAELVEELSELPPEARAALLKSWEQLPLEQLGHSPSTLELEATLKAQREEMARHMYRAAYEEMDEPTTNKLVSRMRELKELMQLEKELLEMHVVEDFSRKKASKAAAVTPQAERQAAGSMPSSATGLQCQPCA